MGYSHYKVFLFLDLTTGQEIRELKKFLLKFPNIIYFVDDVSLSDFDFEALFKSNNDFLEFIDELNEKFPQFVEDFHYFLFVNTIKVNFLPCDLLLTESKCV